MREFSHGILPVCYREEHGRGPGKTFFHLRSKFFLLIQLHLRQWKPSPSSRLNPFKPDGNRLYLRSVNKSKWYLLCLLQHETLWPKFGDGLAKEIKHGMTEGYYKALLLLEGAKFREALKIVSEPAPPKGRDRVLKKLVADVGKTHGGW